MKKPFIVILFVLFKISFSLSQQPADLNPTFNNSLFGFNNNGEVQLTAIQDDGKIIVSGLLYQYNGISCNKIIRLNSDGSIDNTFNIGSGPDNSVSAITIQDDGKILIGGSFQTFNGFSTKRIVRLNSDGSVDQQFNLLFGSFSSFNSSGSVRSISIQSDGQIIIGGDFTTVNGHNNLARLDNYGSLDFNYLPTINGRVRSTKIANDGSLFIGGDFTSYYTTSVNRVAHINLDGSLDAGFNAGNTSTTSIWSGSGIPQQPFIMDIELQNDGKLVVGGKFNLFNGSARNNIIRLNNNGSIDQSFVGSGTNNGFALINDIVIQNNGKILLGGDFTSYNSNSCSRIARLNTDGSYDTLFSPFIAPTANNQINTISIQSNGNIIIGGAFTQYTPAPSGGTASKIAKLTGDCVSPPAPSGDSIQSFCASAMLSDLIVNGINIQWYSDSQGGNSIDLNTPLVDGNTYYASQTETCESTTRLQVSVTIVQPITPTFNQINAICSGNTLSPFPTNSLNNISGTWSPAINNTATTTYTFTPNTGQCANTQTMSITVNPLPIVSLAAFNSVCDTAGIINLTGGNPAGGNYSGTSVSNNTFNTSIGLGSYPITYSYTNNSGCSSNSINNLTVIDCNNVGLSEEKTAKFLLYPNPTNDNLKLESSNNLLGKEYKILDHSGRIIVKGKIIALTQKIELTNISAGFYLFQIENESTSSIKFVKL